MIRTLSKNIRDDYNRGIVAKAHDESHINAYMRTHPCKILSGELNLPEEIMNCRFKNDFQREDSYRPLFQQE